MGRDLAWVDRDAAVGNLLSEASHLGFGLSSPQLV